MRGGRGGRGPGRGRPDDVAATASGPFSLGPAAQGTHERMNLHDIDFEWFPHNQLLCANLNF